MRCKYLFLVIIPFVWLFSETTVAQKTHSSTGVKLSLTDTTRIPQIDDTATVVIMVANEAHWYTKAKNVGPNASESMRGLGTGTVSGAIVGSLICPGIGTFIGAIMGAGTGSSAAMMSADKSTYVEGYWIVVKSKRGDHLRSFFVEQEYKIGQEIKFGDITPANR